MEKEGRGDGLNKIRKGRERRGGGVDVMGEKKEMKQEVGKVGSPDDPRGYSFFAKHLLEASRDT